MRVPMCTMEKYCRGWNNARCLLAYCLPRGNEYTLGGTIFEGDWNTSTGIEEADALVQRCATLIPGIDGWERTGGWTGLRPLRKDGIRLDVEIERLRFCGE